MMGNVSINVSLKNIWKTWFLFKTGKHETPEFHHFQYYLEQNLAKLFTELNNGTYRHGGYKKFYVRDNKTREISVAGIRDRLVHRLMYDYLVALYDKQFIYDAWSCRKGKGLIGAIERAQKILALNQNGYIWKGDIQKFFDSVDHEVLLKILSCTVKDRRAMSLLREIIYSFSRERERE